MATIFEKLPASGENCLILEPRESLIYPFDVGENWNEIRFGICYSFTNQTDSNGNVTTSSSSPGTIATPRNDFFFGIKSDNVTNIPFSGSPYIGFSAGHTANDGLSFSASQLSNGNIGSHVGGMCAFLIPSGVSTLMTRNDSNRYGGIAVAPIFNQTGQNTFYSSILAMKIVLTNRGLSGQQASVSFMSQATTQNPSVETIRSYLSTSFPSQFQVFYTSNYTSTGVPSAIPNSLYFYLPFLNIRTRIHSLLVEKYS